MKPLPGERGFSLIEVLVALTILGVALLLGMELLLLNPRIVRRMEAERQAFRALESTLEAVRAGAISLPPPPPLPASEYLDSFVTEVGDPAPQDLKIKMEVEPTGLPGLVKVTLLASYQVDKKEVGHKRLESMVFSPPKSSGD